MARVSSADPIEKFRFRVTVLTIDLSVIGGIESLANLIPSGGAAGDFLRKELLTISRSGFSEITIPKATINEMTYRENLDSQRFSKIPGLTKYEPVTLKRGVTNSKDLYNWYQLVNDDTVLQAAAHELSSNYVAPPRQSENFRKEVLIDVLDRSGKAIKRWVLFNAFPIAYSGGDNLSANSEEKLIEELTLSYEFFIEQLVDLNTPGDNLAALGEIAKAVASTAFQAAAGAAADKIPAVLR